MRKVLVFAIVFLLPSTSLGGRDAVLDFFDFLKLEPISVQERESHVVCLVLASFEALNCAEEDKNFDFEILSHCLLGKAVKLLKAGEEDKNLSKKEAAIFEILTTGGTWEEILKICSSP